MSSTSFEIPFCGKTLFIETGKLAKQASGSVIVRLGDTMVLVTATVASSPREGIDFFPLLVDFEEKLYAAGKIPGGFFKREGRPTEKAILTARLIDRPLRPLFPQGFRNDVQIVATPLSVDQENPPDILAMIGASTALSISGIPFNGPIGAVRVGRLDGKFVVGPTFDETRMGDLDLVVAGTKDAVLMVEAGVKILPEAEVIEAIFFGHEALQPVIKLQEEMVRAIGKPRMEPTLQLVDEKLLRLVADQFGTSVRDAIHLPGKEQQKEALHTIEVKAVDAMKNAQDAAVQQMVVEHPAYVKEALHEIEKKMVRDMILKENRRPDGRGWNEVRPISAEGGILPRTHGTGLFTRGETQVLTVLTLGASEDEQRIDGLSGDEFKRYMHHYNFPAFSVGEVRPLRSPGRREIGHGALAERALLPVLPTEEEFPYTIRLVSEVLSSNGSTSMASTCGSTLALYDAGVPLKAPVAGVAMGLIQEAGQVAVLTDIQGLEDHLGDMDFKVTGTRDGITALQLDIKTPGISHAIIEQAILQARAGRLHILEKMSPVVDAPVKELSPYAPRITNLKINPEKIGALIGPQGKVIKKIIEETGVKVDIEDDGTVAVVSTDPEASRQAIEKIKLITEDVEVGKVYKGKVMRLMNFGAFIEVLPGKEGLCHISRLSPEGERIGKVEDVVKMGDELMVKVYEVDSQGRINLTRRGL